MTIKVHSITFGDLPFRKLHSTEIPFSDRITLIAGHNGIGKSTILGLLSSTFGLTDASIRSYFNDPFYTNIERIVYIALDEVDAQQELSGTGPVVTAKVGEKSIKKRCSLTRRSEWKRARVVPRTVDPTDEDIVGPDAKIPLPTIFLGTKRLASVGEADEKDVSSSPIDDMHSDDKELMAKFVNSVILGSNATTEITSHSIKGVRKRSAHPTHQDHDTLAISMGQDSLGSIATALASFNKLQREMQDQYPGGLLIIDELDIGLHPHAIDRLITALKTQAKKLELQIIGTTHSPRMITAIHPDGQGDPKSPDSIVYLVDTNRPRLAEDQSLNAILKDMSLDITEEPTAGPPSPICIYFEDQEAMELCDALFPRGKRAALSRKLGRSIKLIPLGIGGSILLDLPNNDPIFQDRVLVVDGDTTIGSKAKARGNAVKLPCPPGVTGTNRSPENLIKNFLRQMQTDTSGPYYDALLKVKTSNPSSDKIRRTFFIDDDGESSNRESSKRWWRKHWPTLDNWNILTLWSEIHSTPVDEFITALTVAINKVATRLK